jgi:hypothetical protein
VHASRVLPLTIPRSGLPSSAPNSTTGLESYASLFSCLHIHFHPNLTSYPVRIQAPSADAYCAPSVAVIEPAACASLNDRCVDFLFNRASPIPILPAMQVMCAFATQCRMGASGLPYVASCCRGVAHY